MEKPDYIPQNYGRIHVVNNMASLFDAKFGPANCIIWPRSRDPQYREKSLTADFNGLAQSLETLFPYARHLDMSHVIPEELKDVKNLPDGQETARQIILADIDEVSRWLQNPGEISLRVAMPRQKPGSFHHDFFTSKLGRLLCAYNDPATEWLRNEDSRSRKLSDHAAVEGAPVFQFHAGDIWRQAKGMPVSGNPLVRAFMNAVFHRKVPPFIHRTPAAGTDAPPRLLLIAE